MALSRPNHRFSTTLYQAADDSQTTLYPNAVPTNVPTILILEPKTDKEEKVKVTDKASNSITVIRGYGGTSAVDHNLGAALVDYNAPEYLDEYADAFEAEHNDDGTHDIDGMVTEDGEQELENKTLIDPVLEGDLTGDAILDEDDMASDSPTKVPSQQSVKAYVDAEIADIDTTPTFMSGKVEATSDTTINANTSTDINGATVTFEPSVASYVIITAFWDIGGGSSGDIFTGQLILDGAQQQGEMLFRSMGSNDRKTVGQTWRLSLTAASHTIKLQAKRPTGSGSATVAWPHSGFTYFVFPQ